MTQVSPDMVEVAARAMLAAHDWTTDIATADGNAPQGFDSMPKDWQDAYRKMALAALTAALGDTLLLPAGSAHITKAHQFPTDEVIGVTISLLVLKDDIDKLPPMFARAAQSALDAPAPEVQRMAPDSTPEQQP